MGILIVPEIVIAKPMHVKHIQEVIIFFRDNIIFKTSGYLTLASYLFDIACMDFCNFEHTVIVGNQLFNIIIEFSFSLGLHCV